MISVSDLFFSYDGEKELFSGLSFSLDGPGVLAFLGPSGCGKSTLMGLLLGELSPQKGRVVCSPAPVPLFQEDRLFPHLSLRKNLLLPLHDLDPKIAEKRVLGALDGVGLLSEANKKASDCSGGMKRRASLARALAFLPESGGVLLLDEPFAGVDDETKQRILSYLNRLQKKHTICLITHDHQDAAFLNAKNIYLGGR